MSDTVIQVADIDAEAPRISFPCPYPIKVMGVAVETFAADVVAVIERHAPPVRQEHIAVRASARGTYVSVTVTIQAQGVEQLQRIFTDLKQTPQVKMVL